VRACLRGRSGTVRTNESFLAIQKLSHPAHSKIIARSVGRGRFETCPYQRTSPITAAEQDKLFVCKRLPSAHLQMLLRFSHHFSSLLYLGPGGLHLFNRSASAFKGNASAQVQKKGDVEVFFECMEHSCADTIVSGQTIDDEAPGS
jgi:hypothetical protein